MLARAAGHQVTGCDAGVYPPMSTQLEAQGIELIEGYGVEQLARRPDLFVIGNVVTRGNPLMEAILERGLPYVSGPQWLGEHVLAGQVGTRRCGHAWQNHDRFDACVAARRVGPEPRFFDRRCAAQFRHLGAA